MDKWEQKLNQDIEKLKNNKWKNFVIELIVILIIIIGIVAVRIFLSPFLGPIVVKI